MGLLDELRRQAQSVSGTEEPDSERLARIVERVDGALRRGFSFFMETASYLGTIRPENKRSFVIPNLGALQGMRESDLFVDYRTVSIFDKARFDRFYVRFTSSSDRVLEKQVDFVTAQKLHTFLSESGLQFKHEDRRNHQGKIVGGTFQVPCVLHSQITFKGDYTAGLVRVTCNNLDWFGEDVFTYDAEEIEVSLLEEYVKYMVGERNYVRQRGRHQGGDSLPAKKPRI
jgi:hypothetical protein